jgi:hypothetical protein
MSRLSVALVSKTAVLFVSNQDLQAESKAASSSAGGASGGPTLRPGSGSPGVCRRLQFGSQPAGHDGTVPGSQTLPEVTRQVRVCLYVRACLALPTWLCSACAHSMSQNFCILLG